jgi:type II secretory ATPase GspE/PulE/Tfp pilus assembly ATPase PilB-like protein
MPNPSQPSAVLPKVDLRNVRIPYDVLSYIPLSTSEKFQIIAFEATETHLKLAVVHPEQLKQGFLIALKDIGRKIDREIDLSRTDPVSMQIQLKAYRQQAGRTHVPPVQGERAIPPMPPMPVGQTPVIPPPPQPRQTVPQPVGEKAPPLFQMGKTVAFNYLLRIPYSFASLHRLVCVDHLPPNRYWFVTDQALTDDLRQIIQFIEEQNHISVQLLTAKPAELDGLLKYYRVKLEEAKAGKDKKAAPPAKQEPVKQPANPDAPIPITSSGGGGEITKEFREDIVVPRVQATIIQSEEEKPGLAGIFQRFTQNIAVHNDPITIEDDLHMFGAVKAPDATKAENPEEKAVPLAAPAPASTIPPAPPAAAPASNGAVPMAPPPPAAPVAPQPVEIVQKKEAPASPIVGAIPAQPVDTKREEAKSEEKSKEPVQTNKEEAKDERRMVNDDNGAEIGKLLSKPVESLDELKKYLEDGYIPRIVAAIVSYAISEKASDIHIEVFDDEVRVRYRIDGQLFNIVKLPNDIHAALVSRIKILSHLRLDESRVPQDGRFDVEVNGKQIDLRVSIMPTIYGEKVVARILEKNKGVTTLDSLGLSGLGYQNLLKAVNKPFGIVLATGPTGSGKSTSLYAILNLIATSNVNVITLEDPVEYEMKGINQSQVRPKIGYSFAEGLRSVLRQDPNIIMVGEIRDGETANMATQAALTGHLVLSTLHTNDASGAIPRLANMGIEPFLIASSLNAVIGQRLVRRICQKCKTEVDMPAGIRQDIVRQVEEIQELNEVDAARVKPPFKFYQGAGCPACKGKGYQGRIGIYEVLPMSEKIEELTLARASGTQIKEAAQKEGMLSMYQDGLLKVVSGLTTLDEVLRETSNK